MKKVGIIIGVLFLLLIGLVNAAPPFIQEVTFTEGYVIEIPQEGILHKDDNFNFHFFVFNISNGVPITNETTSCYFHLFDHIGIPLLDQPLFHLPNNYVNEWEVDVLAGNFTEQGEYTYIVQCNSTTLGGSDSVGLTVTDAKLEIMTSESILYILLTLGVFLIFGLSLYATIVIPYGNKTNESGAVIKITKAKYFKLLMIGVTYAFFVWLLNILIGVSDNYVSLSLYYGFVSFLFTLFINLTLPMFIFILILAFFEIIRDANIMKEIKKFGSVKK